MGFIEEHLARDIGRLIIGIGMHVVDLNGHIATVIGIMRQENVSRRALTDLVDDLDCSLSYSSKGGEIGFIKEWRVLSKRSYLGQDHRVFLAASEMALLFLENARHLLEPKPFYDLLLKCLNALQSGHPTVVKIKTLFVFAETEGLPVRQAWLPELSDSLKDQTKLILSTPTSDLVELPDSSHEILKSLSLWLNSETEIKCSIP